MCKIVEPVLQVSLLSLLPHPSLSFTHSQAITCMVSLNVRNMRPYQGTIVHFAVAYHKFRQNASKKEYPLVGCHWTIQTKKRQWKSQADYPAKATSRPFHHAPSTALQLLMIPLPTYASFVGKHVRKRRKPRNKLIVTMKEKKIN